MTTATYPGTFGPPVKGHVGIVRRALEDGVADKVIVLAIVNQSKNFFLTPANAAALFKRALSTEDISPYVSFESRNSSSMAPPAGTDIYIRGIRSAADKAYERGVLRQIREESARVCGRPLPTELIIDPAAEQGRTMSSTQVRNILFGNPSHHGDLRLYLPIAVMEPLVDAWRETTPNPYLPHTMQPFNVSLAKRLG